MAASIRLTLGRHISIDNIEKLANALGLTVSDLVRPPNGALDEELLATLRRSNNGESYKP